MGYRPADNLVTLVTWTCDGCGRRYTYEARTLTTGMAEEQGARSMREYGWYNDVKGKFCPECRKGRGL